MLHELYLVCRSDRAILTEYRKMIRTDVNTYSYFFGYHSQIPQPYQMGTRIKSVNSEVQKKDKLKKGIR